MSALAAGLLLAAALSASEAPRVALLVGNDTGFVGEQPLRFTGADARRLGAVLEELGGFRRENVHLLENRTAADILDQIDQLVADTPASVFVFYYSGHADTGSLHAGGTVLPIDLLLHRLQRVRADLRLEILDACQSGAATRTKGSVPAPPFSVRVEDANPAGDILVSSSAADEQSFESDHGGVFTLHWTAGLRGAADDNGDGQVTLGEVYAYAYAQTLRSTLVAATGPQHASFRYALEGHRDPVLSRLAGGGLLTLQPQGAGEYVIFDGGERSVIAEVPARPGQPRQLALAPGDYVVRLRGTRSLRMAKIAISRGDDRVLPERQMQEVPLMRLARKGSLGDRFLTVAVGGDGSFLGPRWQAFGALGLEWEGERWLTAVELAGAMGAESHGGLSTDDRMVMGSAALLYSHRVNAVTLRLGPTGGVAYLSQATRSRSTQTSLGAALGGRARLEMRLTPGLGGFLGADGRALALRMARGQEASSGERLGIGWWWAFTAGVRVAF